MPGQKSPSPIVILAATGSGGALLAHALGAHGQLHGLDDGHLCVGLLTELDGPALQDADGHDLGHGLAGDAAPRGIARIDDADRELVIRGLAGERSSAPTGAGGEAMAGKLVRALAGEKAKQAGKEAFALHAAGCATRVDALAQALPDALIIHLVRDGRVIALPGAHSAHEPLGLGARARAWLAEIGPVLRFAAAHPERVITVAYEDLLQEPERELEKLCTAIGLAPEPAAMASALREVLGEGDALGFRPDLLDAWQIVELEGELQPLLALLGYRPATDFAEIARIRARAEAYDRARSETQALRERLARYEDGGGSDPAGGSSVPMSEEPAAANDLAQRYEDAIDELRQLRFQMRNQGDADISTLRWKAKRYDQIRAMASPALRLRRRRGRP